MTTPSTLPPTASARASGSLKWIIIALLLLVVAGLCFNAWRGLNQNTGPAPKANTGARQVEALTPIGGKKGGSPVYYVPAAAEPSTAAASEADTPAAASAPQLAAAPAKKAKIHAKAKPRARPDPVHTAHEEGQELKPVSTQATPKQNIDNLF